jgi:hypothetical protein
MTYATATPCRRNRDQTESLMFCATAVCPIVIPKILRRERRTIEKRHLSPSLSRPEEPVGLHRTSNPACLYRRSSPIPQLRCDLRRKRVVGTKTHDRSTGTGTAFVTHPSTRTRNDLDTASAARICPSRSVSLRTFTGSATNTSISSTASLSNRSRPLSTRATHPVNQSGHSTRRRTRILMDRSVRGPTGRFGRDTAVWRRRSRSWRQHRIVSGRISGRSWCKVWRGIRCRARRVMLCQAGRTAPSCRRVVVALQFGGAALRFRCHCLGQSHQSGQVAVRFGRCRSTARTRLWTVRS